MICTFFGHRDAPWWVKEKLKDVICDLAENKGVKMFYVGNQGAFDYMVKQVLNELGLKYYIVLAYMPTKLHDLDTKDYSDTIYPEGLEKTPPKFAIDKRNRWMIEKSDYVVCFVTKTFGGAAKYKQIAINKNKIVIDL